MILGAFSLAADSDAATVVLKIREMTDSEGLMFSMVAGSGFTGGYYLHPRLPYKNSDFYYSDEANDILVLISGSIYNKAELYHQCNISKPVPDPELAAKLFLSEGSGFVNKLNGDFTIFIVCKGGREAWLFRDQVGIRPLAYTADRQTLLFSSDIIGLCRAFSSSRAIESEYLMGYFKFIDYTKTPDDKVKKLLPGHFLHFSETGIVITKYWEPGEIRIEKKLSYEKMLSDLKSIVLDAIRIRCDYRFTSGAHVSSGLDSGIISTLARREYQNQPSFYGFSWSPGDVVSPEVKFDERELALKSAQNADIRLLFSDMSTENFPRFVSDFYSNHGFWSEDMTVEQAAEVGVNLIFSGWGGDEFISTGDRGIETDLLRGLKLRTFFRRNKINHPGRFVRNQLMYVLFPALGISDRGVVQSFRDDGRYLKKSFRRSDRKAVRNFYFYTSRRQLHLRLLQFYHLQERCESWARNGYRKGVEYRYPLLDKRIIEYMLKIPSELLCKTDHFRPILREISKGILPEEVRLHWQKNDPVYWACIDELFRVSAGSFMEEVVIWEQNTDLHFIDFSLLKTDIVKYKKSPDSIDGKVLFRALVYTKAIHEFTKIYRTR